MKISFTWKYYSAIGIFPLLMKILVTPAHNMTHKYTFSRIQ